MTDHLLQAPAADESKQSWLDYLFHLPPDFVSLPQRLQFMLMIEGSWDEFHAPEVVLDLLTNRRLWTAAMMITDGSPLWPLPYLDDCWNADTLYLSSTGESPDQLKEIADRWNGETNWLEYSQIPKWNDLEVGPILRVWWS